jgi:hypothetical protein
MSKTKTRYKKAYYDLVTPENLAKIKTVLKERGSYDSETIDKIQYQEENNLPYLLIEEDSGAYLGQGNYGMVDGIFVNFAFEKIILSVMELFSQRFNPLKATKYEIGKID